MKYYVHAYADPQRRLPKRETIIEAQDDEQAYELAYAKFPDYEEIYVERADNDLLQERRKTYGR